MAEMEMHALEMQRRSARSLSLEWVPYHMKYSLCKVFLLRWSGLVYCLLCVGVCCCVYVCCACLALF
jgi:hypothetical protein